MARAMLLLRMPVDQFGEAGSASRLKSLVALGFACGVAAGLLHARMVGLI